MVTTQAVVDRMKAMQSAPIQEEFTGIEPEMAEEITVREVPVVQDIRIQERLIPEEPIGDQPLWVLGLLVER
jgi:hypothetical protein